MSAAVAAVLQAATHMQEFESQLSEKLPQLSVADRSLVIRPLKQMGQLLDERGWRTGSVPIDIRAGNRAEGQSAAAAPAAS